MIALGSNLGDRRSYIERAVVEIARIVGPVLARARLYETAPVGAADAPFLNSALVAASILAPDEAMRALLAIEAGLGRIRAERWGNRVIDLDILLWSPDGSAVSVPFTSATVEVPHPRMMERAFVLVPAAEVGGDWMVEGTTLAAAVAVSGFRLDVSTST